MELRLHHLPSQLLLHRYAIGKSASLTAAQVIRSSTLCQRPHLRSLNVGVRCETPCRALRSLRETPHQRTTARVLTMVPLARAVYRPLLQSIAYLMLLAASPSPRHLE